MLNCVSLKDRYESIWWSKYIKPVTKTRKRICLATSYKVIKITKAKSQLIRENITFIPMGQCKKDVAEAKGIMQLRIHLSDEVTLKNMF